jgi:Ca2+-binding RTX toxin-like protein
MRIKPFRAGGWFTNKEIIYTIGHSEGAWVGNKDLRYFPTVSNGKSGVSFGLNQFDTGNPNHRQKLNGFLEYGRLHNMLSEDDLKNINYALDHYKAGKLDDYFRNPAGQRTELFNRLVAVFQTDAVKRQIDVWDAMNTTSAASKQRAHDDVNDGWAYRLNNIFADAEDSWVAKGKSLTQGLVSQSERRVAFALLFEINNRVSAKYRRDDIRDFLMGKAVTFNKVTFAASSSPRTLQEIMNVARTFSFYSAGSAQGRREWANLMGNLALLDERINRDWTAAGSDDKFFNEYNGIRFEELPQGPLSSLTDPLTLDLVQGLQFASFNVNDLGVPFMGTTRFDFDPLTGVGKTSKLSEVYLDQFGNPASIRLFGTDGSSYLQPFDLSTPLGRALSDSLAAAQRSQLLDEAPPFGSFPDIERDGLRMGVVNDSGVGLQQGAAPGSQQLNVQLTGSRGQQTSATKTFSAAGDAVFDEIIAPAAAPARDRLVKSTPIPRVDSAGRIVPGYFDGQANEYAGGATVRKYYDGPLAGITRIKMDKAQAPLGFIQFDQAGALLGNLLGKTIAGDNKVARLVSSAFFKTAGHTLGGILNGKLTGAPAQSIKDVIASFDNELLRNLKSKGIGAISSFLVSNLVDEIGIEGFAGEVVNTAASEALRSALANLAGIQTNNIVANVGNAVGALIGTKLASEVMTFSSVGGQLGSMIGSTIGSIVATSTSLIFTAGTSTASAAVLGLEIGAFAGPVAAAIGAFVGYLLGGVIGSVFGGTPRSGADVEWDEQQGKFAVTNIYSRKHGSRDAAEDMAATVADTFNSVIEATGGTLLDPKAVQSGNYGMRNTNLVYRPAHTRDKDAITYRVPGKAKDAMGDVAAYGIYKGFTDPDFKLAGGDVYVKRAFYNTFDAGDATAETFDPATLLGNITSAANYSYYVQNAAAINALVAAETESVFAVEVAVTLARASELGLGRRHNSDWYGGFDFLIREAEANAAQVEFGFNFDPVADRISRAIYVGEYVLDDFIDVGGQTLIEGTEGGDTIRLTARSLKADGGRVYGTADRIESANALKVNGATGDFSAVEVEVAATIDAGAGDDIVHGGDLGSNVFGGSGDDKLYGGVLDDWLLGGEGVDRLYAGDSASDGTAGPGLGGDGNYLHGGGGDDFVYGREGSDWLEGGEGTDILEGGDGDDNLAGGVGEAE